MPKPISIALLGQKFMGRAHSNAWGQVGRFFDLPRPVRLATVAARDAAELATFAECWGWENWTTRWRSVAADEGIDLVDVGTPNHLHAQQAIAMLEAGKHVACEKPLAGNLDDARAMRQAARKASGRTFVWFNYRRCPAVALAQRLVAEGRLGRIHHVRATYLQEWGGPETPMSWRFKKAQAGSGAHGDLNAHIVDMARFVTGQELVEVGGALSRTFVKERRVPGTRKKARSTVDDSLLFIATLSGGGSASFEASRVAPGHQNRNTLEVNGSDGSLAFDFEDMNVLRFMDAADGPREAGWRRIMCTNAEEHPYAGAWWPDAHVLGYEHGFTNMAADIVRAICRRRPEAPLPDFEDAWQTQRVLEAALVSARERCAVPISQIR
ncbi:MAG: dehydrogenase [Planctomycetes bacterium]|jgi:predicted dehydrogenase|nr:dehydrogenase [Planctomycetota bacterium]HJO26693.1 Gfo/Idh/MocA family oxidoreductase [Planctomycetota bacterium]